jgi:hypothetical protein
MWLRLRVTAIAVLALACAAWPKLALPAAFLTWIGFLSLPKGLPRAAAQKLRLTLAFAAICATLGTLRFVVSEAVPGIIQGGKDAAASSALSRLREIVFAEDAMRTHAYVDPDRDGVGSAGFVAELTGALAPRHASTFSPVLNPRYRELVETRAGSALKVAGYLYMVCLPRPGGGFTARSGERLDEELAERRFVAYAWPAAPSGRIESAFFADEHERILVSKNVDGNVPRYVGADFPPECDAAVKQPGQWQPWRDKQPRRVLPGDVAASR